VTDEYVASLEKRIEELEQQRANLSYILRPYFKILVKDDKVACLQLYVKVKHGFDPFASWGAPQPTVGVQPIMNQQVVRDLSNMDSDGLSGSNIISHFLATDERTWKGTVFRPDDDKEYEVEDADHTEMKHIMLGLCGLSGLTYGSHTEPYITKEDRMKPAAEALAKQIMDWEAKSGKMGVAARGLGQWTIAAIKDANK
jgi:hypothetical protein